MAHSTASTATQRPPTPGDLFRLERIDQVTISPDGNTFAFTRHTPLSSAPSSDRLRSDVWIATLDGGAVPMNITKGQANGISYWMPKWSPDGSSLAMLSTKDGARITLCAWNKHGGRLRRLGERGLE